MSSTLHWVLASPPATGEAAANDSLPPTFSASSCVEQGYDQAALLAVVERSYPRDYLEGLRSRPGGGYELFQSAAAVLARCSDAVSELYCCSLLAFAHGGVLATGTVEFYRNDFSGGAVTLGQGSFVATSRTGRRFLTQAPVVFGSTDLGPHAVGVQAEAVGSEYNVAGVTLTAGGESLEGEIDTVLRLAPTSVGFDPAVQVRQLAPTSGGLSACLDGLGGDVLIPRQTLEQDDRYRLRIVTTPDTVSPDAIQRGLDGILGALGQHGCLREVGTPRLPGLFFDAGSSADSPQVPAHNFAFDMDFSVRPDDRFKLLLSLRDSRAFFLIGVPRLVETDFGAAFDGATTDAFPLQNAFDTTSPTASSAAFDGFTTLQGSLYRSIFAMLDQKRAAGVGFELYIESVSCTP